MEQKTKQYCKRFIYFLLANLCYALAINLFLVPHNIAAGGFVGVATVINYVVPIPIGLTIFLMNIPFFIIALKVKGVMYTVLTILSSSVYSMFIDLTAFLPVATENPLVAAIFGGVIYGFGAVLFMMANASSGGTDLVARLLVTKFKSMSIGKMFLVVDGSVAILSILVQKNLEAGLFAITTIFICSKVNDAIINGFDFASLFFIITEKDPSIIANTIMPRLTRGVTSLQGRGMFTGQDRNVLMVAVKKSETYKVKEIISQVDENAFVVVAQANEVLGGGFKEVVAKEDKKKVSVKQS